MNEVGPFDFINEINSSYIGFGGAIVVLSLFCFFNRKHLVVTEIFFVSVFIYAASLGTGIGLDGTVTDRNSALIAGLWAPMVYSLLATILIRRFVPLIKPEKTDLDHFIDQ